MHETKEQWKKEMFTLMWDKLDRYSTVIVCGRGRIDELVMGKTEDFGMSECN